MNDESKSNRGTENNSPPKGDFTKSKSPNKGELQSTKKILLHTQKIQMLILLQKE